MLGPIRTYKKRIESEAEARSIHGVGEKTAKKVGACYVCLRMEDPGVINCVRFLSSQIMEIIRTGCLRRISYERTQDVYIVMAFQGIYGVGQLLVACSFGYNAHSGIQARKLLTSGTPTGAAR